MGHVRLKTLPRTRQWEQVVELLEDGAPVEGIAAASADAADGALGAAAFDPALAHIVWLLTQVPAAARNGSYVRSLNSLGIQTAMAPSLLGLLAGLERAVDVQARQTGARTDLGEMAQLAAATSLTNAVGPELPSLFGTTAADVRSAIAKLGTRDRFAKLSRAFFADLMRRSLEYYLSRTYADHIGPVDRFATISDKEAFRRALEVHCFETALVVEEYSRRWFSKHTFADGISREDAGQFARRAFGKIRKELRRRRRTDG